MQWRCDARPGATSLHAPRQIAQRARGGVERVAQLVDQLARCGECQALCAELPLEPAYGPGGVLDATDRFLGGFRLLFVTERVDTFRCEWLVIEGVWHGLQPP